MTHSKIRVLNDQTINKIAAGEVIENPASVVKELVENSLDAGATHICVEIQEGGRQLIRISDDGCGMSSDDALLCLERHATSKIREVEDIEALLTMGFRGEAVPSIAAISKFTLLTSPKTEGEKENEGTFINIEGGRLLSCSPATRSHGTTIEVKSLFFNVPVRRKFQKSPTFDIQEILKMLGFLALAYPAIQFELISDQKSILKTPLSSSPNISFHDLLGKRLESILGTDYATASLPLKFQQDPYELIGYIGAPHSHKPNRTGQHLFINQRLVYSPLIASAVREGYGTMLPTHRYPIFVLHLRMPGNLLDVNVHPQKKEVRLRQELQLKETIIHAVQTILRQEQKQFTPLSAEDELSIPPFWSHYTSPLSPALKTPSAAEEKWEFKNNSSSDSLISDIENSASFKEMNFLENSPPFIHSQPQTQHQLAAQTPNFDIQPKAPNILATLQGYCILEPFQLESRLIGASANKREGGLLLLDQRAAYSRIHYEKLLKNRTSSKETQPLLIPLTVPLSKSEFEAMQEYASLLNEMGFGLREFGENIFLLDAYPSFLKENELHNFLNLLTQDLVDLQSSRRLQLLKEEQLALAACRSSLPTTQRLSLDEAQGLIQQLLMCDSPAQCPFGKPTTLYLSPDDLAKWFQKINF